MVSSFLITLRSWPAMLQVSRMAAHVCFSVRTPVLTGGSSCSGDVLRPVAGSCGPERVRRGGGGEEGLRGRAREEAFSFGYSRPSAYLYAFEFDEACNTHGFCCGRGEEHLAEQY